MKQSIALLALTTLVLGVSMTSARPGHLLYGFPAAQSHTSVVRDALGNQATSYAYEDHSPISSSSVAVNRNDVSKHLAYVPAPAPVVYHEAAPVYHEAYPHQAYHHVPAAAYYDPYYV